MESDIRYYRRRASEEMGAANRAVTEAARERRMQLVDQYLQRLAALKEPSPFDGQDFTGARGRSAAGGNAKSRAKRTDRRSAFASLGAAASR